MWGRLRSIFTNSSGQIVSQPIGSGAALTAQQVLTALQTPQGSNSLAMMLLDNAQDISALRYSPLLSAVRFISEALATMPLIVRDDANERATDHPIYKLLQTRPNEAMTPFHWKRIMVERQLVLGNGFSLIERDGAGNPVNLVLLDNANVTTKYANGVKYFEYKSPAVEGTIANEDMVHYVGFTRDGLHGIPLLHYCTDVVRLGIAVEKYALKYFANGRHGNGHLEAPLGVNDKQLGQVAESWRQSYDGGDNSWTTPILPYGIKYVPDTPTNDDAQLLELRKFQVIETSRVTRVKPSILYHYETGGTYANLEAQQTDTVVDCLQSWITANEQELDAKLFPDGDYCIEYLIDARLRGDTLSRLQSYEIGRRIGLYTVNDIRRLENLPEVDGGDDVQMTPTGAAPNETPAEDKTDTQAETPAEQQQDAGGQ